MTDPGENMRATATTTYNGYFCTAYADAPIWSVQFYPEFTARRGLAERLVARQALLCGLQRDGGLRELRCRVPL